MFKYSRRTTVTLLCMIIFGAVRIVSVRLFYQLGFEDPLLVTLLYLIGQSLSLVFHWASKYVEKRHGSQSFLQTAPVSDHRGFEKVPVLENGFGDESLNNKSEETVLKSDKSIELSALHIRAHHLEDTHHVDDETVPTNSLDDGTVEADTMLNEEHSKRRKGSDTGLTDESDEAVSWVHTIPWYIKPIIPAFFNLCNSGMRLASLIYVAASVAEILMSGLELTLSVVAARLVRKRRVSFSRWIGVGIVVISLLIVGAADLVTAEKDKREGDEGSRKSHLIGLALIVGECITSVMQDITEEVFLQESDFPAALLLGVEGLFGAAILALFYVPLSHMIDEDPRDTFERLSSSFAGIGYTFYLTTIFAMTSITNILATAATSSMTRNVWKNLRTLLVWLLGLVVFAVSGNDHLGEPWRIPASLIVPSGSCVTFVGICFYYKDKK